MRRRASWIVAAALVVAAVATVTIMRRGGGATGAGDEAGATDVAVRVGTIARATLHRFITAYGTVEPEPGGSGRAPARAVIGSPVGGVVTHVDCGEGQRVTRGTVLFRLDDRAAEVARARARDNLDFAERTIERQRKLLASGGASERAVQEAELQRDAARSELAAAETQLSWLRIASPLDGTVVRVGARLGQAVDASTVLAEVVDLSRLAVSAAVASREAPLVEVGQKVELGEGPAHTGTVVFVGREIDAGSDTVPVRIGLVGATGMQPGQFLAVRIVVEERRDCLAVPLDSLVTRGGEGSWIVIADGGRAYRKPVTPGLREGGLVEVSGEGLREGMSIVTEDAYSLPQETRIHVVDR